MPVVRITGQGLSAIAFSVALLWGCLIGERVIRRNADTERVRILRDLDQLRRRRPIPVSAPAPVIPRHPFTTAC